MGLDMYLYRETYIWRHGDNPPTLTVDYPGIQTERVCHIDEKVGYWRKANAIHQWFVDNVQGGEDRGQKSTVDKEDFEKLLDTVTKVQADHKLASELLPTTDGFFFGNTSYDSVYFDDLEDTRKILEATLAEIQGEADAGKDRLLRADYYYQASW